MNLRPCHHQTRRSGVELEVLEAQEVPAVPVEQEVGHHLL